MTEYASSSLRRYSGSTYTPDKVRAFCVSARNLSSATVFGIQAADQTGYVGVVSLSGAAALTAAITFGYAALAL